MKILGMCRFTSHGHVVGTGKRTGLLMCSVFACLVSTQVCPAPVMPTAKTEALVTHLHHPWALAFLPNQRGFLITERRGLLWWVDVSGTMRREVSGLPPVRALGQGGLLDLAVDRDFSVNRMLYFCLSREQGTQTATVLYRAQLSAEMTRLEHVQSIFVQKPALSGGVHFGCRIAQDMQGNLLLTLGERGHAKEQAQKLDNHLGKVVRIRPDGGIPQDNPFMGNPQALPEIWSYGHRNMQGAVLGPDGQVWTHEHGPQGGDEINIVQPGRNYGWPVITYGENYGGGKIGEGITAKSGMEQPLHYWVPSIAPSDMAFLNSSRYGEAMRGRLLVGSLKFGRLHMLDVRGGKVLSEQTLPMGARVRDVRVGPDGLIYLLTDEDQGKLLRLLP